MVGRVLANLWAQALDLVFPVFCLRCRREGAWVCSSCLDLCPPLPLQCCVFCRSLSSWGATCNRCSRRHVLAGVTVRGVYQAWVWRQMIHTWKYRGATELSPLLRRHLLDTPLPTEIGERLLVITIPLARQRRRVRGFNQAEHLALALTGKGEVASTALRRVRETVPQAALAPLKRQHNMLDAFQASVEVRGRACLIVDDIVTTGATLEAAARALRSAGAASVWGVVLVRSELHV